MIIFDLDDCLANCDHRKHLLDPNSYPEICEYSNYRLFNGDPVIDLDGKASWRYKSTGEPFIDGLKSFNESCDKDIPIKETIQIITSLLGRDYYANDYDVNIWSSRCESVRNKTEIWLDKWGIAYNGLKMRPIGDSTPQELLKSKWMNEALEKGFMIDYVFDAHKKSISMWRSRGVFVFNCIKPKW